MLLLCCFAAGFGRLYSGFVRDGAWVDYLGCFGCDDFSLVFACIDCGGFVSLCLWVWLVM